MLAKSKTYKSQSLTIANENIIIKIVRRIDYEQKNYIWIWNITGTERNQ